MVINAMMGLLALWLFFVSFVVASVIELRVNPQADLLSVWGGVAMGLLGQTVVLAATWQTLGG